MSSDDDDDSDGGGGADNDKDEDDEIWIQLLCKTASQNTGGRVYLLFLLLLPSQSFSE